MSSKAIEAAHSFYPPLEGGGLALDVTTTTAGFDFAGSAFTKLTNQLDKVIDDYWFDRYISLYAEGANVFVAFSDVDTLDIDPTSTGTGLVADTGFPIVDGTFQHFYLPSKPKAGKYIRYMRFVTASGTAILRVWPSSPKEPK